MDTTGKSNNRADQIIGILALAMIIFGVTNQYNHNLKVLAAVKPISEPAIQISIVVESPVRQPVVESEPFPSQEEIWMTSEFALDGSLKNIPIPPKNTEPEQVLKVYRDFIRRDNPKLDVNLVEIVARMYLSEEEKYGLDYGLLPAIAHVESRHRPNAKSNNDAHGLMQIQRPTGREWAKKIGVWQEPKIKPKAVFKNASAVAKEAAQKEYWKHRAEAEKQLIRVILEPTNNIRLGARVLDCYLAEAGGNLDVALARYSGGATNYASKVKRAHQVILTSLELNLE